MVEVVPVVFVVYLTTPSGYPPLLIPNMLKVSDKLPALIELYSNLKTTAFLKGIFVTRLDVSDLKPIPDESQPTDVIVLSLLTYSNFILTGNAPIDKEASVEFLSETGIFDISSSIAQCPSTELPPNR